MFIIFNQNATVYTGIMPGASAAPLNWVMRGHVSSEHVIIGEPSFCTRRRLDFALIIAAKVCIGFCCNCLGMIHVDLLCFLPP